jgi:hypothetical protein
MVVSVPDGKRPEVEHAIEAAGGSILPYHLVGQGLSLVLDERG